ncbi:Scr1 family TA system antitoxin-like transcriptional regulator [Streptomyces xanthochromogenes]|uniref:Scr1 family TA system antitoxin-like transcriptional regulator n=1 Tax=Streptomyces xanthochromogenes TaxID=67384 RepID=UPI003413A0BA
MPEAVSSAKPESAARLLGEFLRQLRKERGLALRDVAPVIRGSVSKISRLERGESPPKPRDVYDLVRFYEVYDGEQMYEVEALLRLAQDDAWWSKYSDLTPNWLKRLIGLEGAATKISAYENHVVPGLLQTPAYARAIIANGMPGADPSEIERRVELRLDRQRVLHSVQHPLIVALLDEAVLRRPMGGPEVMCEQLDYLLQMATYEKVNIRIVEFESSASYAPSYPITHLTFGDGGPAELVYVEHIDSAMYISRPTEIEQYRHVLLRVSGAAAPREESLDLLRTAYGRYARRAAGLLP